MRIMETKALVCDIEPGRRRRGPERCGTNLHEKLEQPA